MTDKRKWFQKLARFYVRRRLRAVFSDVRARGLGELARALEKGPIIVASNHVCWWDPLLMLHLDACLDSEGYCLMDKANLERLGFFRWVGAIPLDRSSSKSAYEDLLAAATLLDRPGRMLVIFPHGEQRPAHLPLGFRAGVHALAARSAAPVYPLALRYDFHQSDKPLVHLSVGKPLSARGVARQAFVPRLEDQVRRELDRVDEELRGDGEGFDSMVGRNLDIHRAHLPGGTRLLERAARSEGRQNRALKGAAQ